MRLLNTNSLEFRDFFDSEVPVYAILSHRWEDKEVLYKEFKKDKASEGPGLNKIRASCALAADYGYHWIWIDTCCIDKRSSAELSEAINSMYNWYSRSAVCFVYLSDVCYSPSDVSILETIQGACVGVPHAEAVRDQPLEFSAFHDWDLLKHQFRNSSWFKRGWTLQELLAPYNIVFFDQHWAFIGDFSHLEDDIAETTGIPREYLRSRHKDASVAQKMSWASRRMTSRGEDLAYCLLGLFDINMPLLYGEGADKAFYRLQSEILRTSNDESIFAWTAPREFAGLLASHPEDFADSGDFVPIPGHWNTRPHYTLTNRGLQLSIPSSNTPLDGALTMTMQLYCNRTSPAETPEKDRASRYQAPVLHLFWHKDSYIRFKCDTLQCNLRKSHPSIFAESSPDDFSAIYVRCFRLPFFRLDKAERLAMDHKASINDP